MSDTPTTDEIKHDPKTFRGWIGVDLDGTLAHYDHWRGVEHIGEPIAPMLARVKRWLDEGKDVRIFTARVFPSSVFELATNLEGISPADDRKDLKPDCLTAGLYIREWCHKHIGRVLPITCRKDMAMVELWDDRAVGVLQNRGITREDLIAYHMARVMGAAGMKVVHGMEYGPAADQAAKKIRTVLQSAKDAHAYLDGARDALDYALKHDEAERELYLRQARTALVKALEPLMRATAE